MSHVFMECTWSLHTCKIYSVDKVYSFTVLLQSMHLGEKNVAEGFMKYIYP